MQEHLHEPPDVFPWWDQEQAPVQPQRVVQHQRVTPSRARRHGPAKHAYQHRGWEPARPQTSSAPVPVRVGFVVQTPPVNSNILLLALVPLLLLAGAVAGVVIVVTLALVTA